MCKHIYNILAGLLIYTKVQTGMLESMDWTFWWNWIPESPKQCDEIDRLDVVGRNKTWKVQTPAPFLAVGGLGRERGAGCTALASGQPGLDDCRYPLVRRVEL